MFGFLAPILGAASSIFGAKMASDSAEDAAEATNARMAADSAANRDLQLDLWRKNADLQREFAQSGIRWRVDDAKASGIHPLYAIGAQGASYTPSTVSLDTPNYIPESSGSFWSSAGQDISRAIDATRTIDERYDARLRDLTLQKGQAELELLQAQKLSLLAKVQQAGQPPPIPSLYSQPSSSNAMGADAYGPWKVEPMEVQGFRPDAPMITAGPSEPMTTFKATDTGATPWPAKNLNLDDTSILDPRYWSWAWRNHVLPTWDKFVGAVEARSKPTMAELHARYPKAIDWTWSISQQEWVPQYGWRGKIPPLE